MNASRNMMTDEERWQAVASRDARTRGLFVYGVITTGVFCHPDCSSRLPRPENVAYFASVAEALRAGYRPCMKCRPLVETNDPALPDVISQALQFIETSFDPPSLGEIATKVGMSPYHFQRVFKRAIGVSPRAYISARRVDTFCQNLNQARSVTDALYAAGYGATSRCYDEVGPRMGMTPSQFRRFGRGTAITYGCARCSVGMVLVGMTSRGVCAITFGEHIDELRAALHAQFSAAKIEEGGEEFREMVSAVIAYIDNSGGPFPLPLDVQATAFQARVWEALRQIPVGATVSYADIAETIGCPNAARAVARACSANTVAVAIPCHRVLRKDGSLGGYRWGTRRKKEFLARERKLSGDSK